jgi:hypothetical protein
MRHSEMSLSNIACRQKCPDYVATGGMSATYPAKVFVGKRRPRGTNGSSGTCWGVAVKKKKALKKLLTSKMGFRASN